MFIVKTDGIEIYLISSHEIRFILTAYNFSTFYMYKTVEQVAASISTYHMLVQGRTETKIHLNVIDVRQGLDKSLISFSFDRASTSQTINKIRVDDESD